MIRRFNHTGRRTIARRHAQVTLRKLTPEETYFELELDLSSYGFPDDARIRVDAWRSNAAQRWDFGTVGDLRQPTQADRLLREVPDSAKFRVAVVAADDSGLLYGLSSEMTPRRMTTDDDEESAVESMLHVQVVGNLGQEVWRLDFGDEELPVLQLNESVTDIAQIIERDAAFRALVIPGVFRAILQRAVLVARVDPDDPEPNAWTDWLDLAKQQAPEVEVPVLSDPSDISQRDAALLWIEQVVQRFASQEGLQAANAYSRAVEAGS